MVTVKMICVFVFAYARSRFSHDEAHSIIISHFNELRPNKTCLRGFRPQTIVYSH